MDTEYQISQNSVNTLLIKTTAEITVLIDSEDYKHLVSAMITQEIIQPFKTNGDVRFFLVNKNEIAENNSGYIESVFYLTALS